MLEIFVLAIIIVISGILAVSIYTNNPKSATGKTFVLSALSIIFWAIVMYLSVNTSNLDMTLFYIRLSMLAGTVMAQCFLILAIVFPNSTLNISKIWLSLYIMLGIFTSVIAMSPYMFTTLIVDGPNIEPQAGWGIATFLLTSIGSNIATFIVLVAKYRRSKGRLKAQLRFIVIGTLLMFALLILGNFLAVILLKTSSFIFLGPLFTLTFLISIAYAILKHKLLDIRTVIARAVSYTALLSLIVLLEVAIFWVGTQILPLNIDRSLIALTGSILIVMSYSSIRSVITDITERIFFQGRYDQEDLLKSLTSIMVSEMDVKFLKIKLLKMMIKEMKLVSGDFVLVSDFVSKPRPSLGAPSTNITKYSVLEKVLHSIKKTLVFEELTDEYHKEIFRKLDIEIILPLIVGDEDIGLLILGPKLSGDIYMDRDIEFLEIFAPQVAIALKNADSYRQIQEFNQTLELKVIDRTHELEAAQAAELKLKDEFVFIATHDLATPVTAISGFSALIKARKDKLPEPVAKDLNAIDEASNRLKVLVNDLLQVARSDSGTIKVELTRINATEILDSAIREIGPLAGEKRVTVISKVSSKLMILADSVKLAEVFENLLSNGVKYNKSGGTLTISSRTSGGKIVIEFKDTGLGIDDEEQAKVFTKFFRSETAEVRQRPGTGLGLFVVRMLIEKMGGKITFESVKDIGTTFWLEFNT